MTLLPANLIKRVPPTVLMPISPLITETGGGNRETYQSGIYIANNKWDLADGYSNSRRIHSTDHLRLKNLSLGVTIPHRFTDYVKISNARIFASATNILTLSKWKMYDPEVGFDGVMGWQTPPLKTFAFGIDITL